MNQRLRSYAGLNLCSTRDPQKEGERWCDLVLTSEKEVARHYWVIGLGAGYHLEALAKRRPNSVISVIECRQEIIDAPNQWDTTLAGQILIEKVRTSVELFATKSFEIYGLEFSPVYCFVPALQGIESWSQRIYADLLGYSNTSFRYLAEKMKLSLNQNSATSYPEAIINIKHIDREVGGLEARQDKKIVQLLRELVR